MDKWAAESQITAANLSLEIINLQVLVSTPIKSMAWGTIADTKYSLEISLLLTKNKPSRRIIW